MRPWIDGLGKEEESGQEDEYDHKCPRRHSQLRQARVGPVHARRATGYDRRRSPPSPTVRRSGIKADEARSVDVCSGDRRDGEVPV